MSMHGMFRQVQLAANFATCRFTKPSAQDDTPAGGDFKPPRTLDELIQLITDEQITDEQITNEQIIAIVESSDKRIGWYFSGETETLEPKDKQKLYRSRFKETPEELDSTIKEEFYTYLEKLGFQNPERYILLYGLPHSKQAVAAADMTSTGDKSGIVRVHQYQWRQSTPMVKHSLVIHETMHILHPDRSRLYLYLTALYRTKETSTIYKKLKKEYGRMTAEGEVYAEIAALDLSCFSEGWLIIDAIHNEHNKTPDEYGHLLYLEKPFSLSMWRKKKEELGLKNSQSILEYHQKNSPALINFSAAWVKNRKKNIEEASHYANDYREFYETCDRISEISKNHPQRTKKIKEQRKTLPEPPWHLISKMLKDIP